MNRSLSCVGGQPEDIRDRIHLCRTVLQVELFNLFREDIRDLVAWACRSEPSAVRGREDVRRNFRLVG